MMKRTFSAFLGLACLEGETFLAFCDEARPATAMEGFQTYEIHSVFFFSLRDQALLKEVPERPAIFRSVRGLNQLLETGFYFSYRWDITRSLQFQNMQPSQNYTWNEQWLRGLAGYPHWRTVIMQGYVNSM